MKVLGTLACLSCLLLIIAESSLTFGSALTLTVSTTKPAYYPNETILVRGELADSGGPLAGDFVIVSLREPNNSTFLLGNLRTDVNGDFNLTFSTPATNESFGRYTVYASASSLGQTATNNTAFVVLATTHDVAVSDVVPSKTILGQDLGENITVALRNQGIFPETFNITLYANFTTIAVLENITLASGSSMNTAITWTANSTTFPYGNYTISAYATLVQNETNTADNTFVDGWVVVTIPGDINGDFKVNLQDLVILANAYGSKLGNANWNPNADLDNNGRIELPDLTQAATHYGQTYP